MLQTGSRSVVGSSGCACDAWDRHRKSQGVGRLFPLAGAHSAVQDDVVATSARHQSFIASHLLAGIVALLVFPIYLVVSGKPTLLGAIAFLWLLSPIGIAVFLSRTGKFATAHLISAANLAGLITFFCWLTGGILSFLVPWMVVVPLEAALARDIRIVAWATLLASLRTGRAAHAWSFRHAPLQRAIAIAARAWLFRRLHGAWLCDRSDRLAFSRCTGLSEDAVRIGEDR